MEEQDLIEELQAFTTQAPTFTPRSLTNLNNRWLVRSAFQKAIRRGQVDAALRYGEYMFYHQDLTYPWSALATVIIEDVGFGDLDLVAYSTVANLKGVRDYMEEELLFAAMILKACKSPKSRSCCELDLGYNMRLGEFDKKTNKYPGPMGEANRIYYEMDETALIGILAAAFTTGSGTGISALEHAHAAALALRKKYRHRPIDEIIPALTMIRDSFPDEQRQRACMLSFERTTDTMNVALFPIMKWEYALNLHEIEVPEEQLWPESVEIMSVGSEAFDMHTKQGKMALKAFWKYLVKENLHPWFAQLSDSKATRGVGALVFICEGGMVDRRLVNAEFRALQHYQDINFVSGYSGVPILEKDDFLVVLDHVRDNIPELNELRKWAVDKD